MLLASTAQVAEATPRHSQFRPAGAPTEAPSQPSEAASAAGELAAAADEPASADWPWDALETVDAGPFYLDVARAGIQYGPAFQMVCKLSGDGTTVVLR